MAAAAQRSCSCKRFDALSRKCKRYSETCLYTRGGWRATSQLQDRYQFLSSWKEEEKNSSRPQAPWGWYVHKGDICMHPAQETLEPVDSPFSDPVWVSGVALGYCVRDNVQPCGWIISAVPGWQRHLCGCLAHPFPRSKLTCLLHSCTDLGGEPSGKHTLFSKECIQIV